MSEVLSDKANRKALLVSIGCMFFQQMSGINVVIFYMVGIFKSTGSTISPNTCTIVVGVIQVKRTSELNVKTQNDIGYRRGVFRDVIVNRVFVLNGRGFIRGRISVKIITIYTKVAPFNEFQINFVTRSNVDAVLTRRAYICPR